jgi:hypothetical protein
MIYIDHGRIAPLVSFSTAHALQLTALSQGIAPANSKSGVLNFTPRSGVG